MHNYSYLLDVPFILNPYLWILIISIFIIYKFSKRGLTHPLVIFFLYITLYFPLKYFLIKIMGIEYTYYANQLGNFKDTGYIEFGGFIFLIYLLLSIVFYQIFLLLKLRVPIFSIVIKRDLYASSFMMLAILILIILIFVPTNKIYDGISVRNFLSTKGVGYLYVFYQLLIGVAIIQLFVSKKYKKLFFLFVINSIFTIFSGSFSQTITWVTLLLLLLFMVYEKHPNLFSIIFSFIILFLVALLHGYIRVQGNIIGGLNKLINSLTFSEIPEIVRSLSILFVDRIDQLEEFSLLVSSIADGKVETNIYWPLNFFVQFIPRFLWETKPYFFSAHMMTLFYPEVLDAGVTFNFLGLGEFIYTFSFLGIFFAALLTGFLFYLTIIYIKESKSRPDIFIFYFFVIFFYLNAGFHGGWLNSPILAFTLIHLFIFLFIGKIYFTFVRP